MNLEWYDWIGMAGLFSGLAATLAGEGLHAGYHNHTSEFKPLEGEALRRQYEDIIPGYYSNKVHWNSVKPDGAVPDELLRTLLDKSYELILHSLSKKRQKEIAGA